MEDLAPTELRNTLRLYVDGFRDVQESFKAHLRGKTCHEPPLLPAFLPPSSYWTSAEKDLFFHALSVYSRLQPELIARHIKTKTTFDVCVYLDALKTAADLIGEDEEEVDGVKLSRADMEPAMEVSENWVLREETIAESLIVLDACPLSLEGAANKKQVERCTCSLNGNTVKLEEMVVDNSMSSTHPNNHLHHLDPTCLRVLEMMRRKEENVNYSEDPQLQMEEQQGSTSLLDPQGSLPSNEALSEAIGPALINPPPEVDKAQLRRIQKRLYMRRKRAEAAGKTVSVETGKLRPGRLLKERKAPKPRPKKYKTRKSGQSPNPVALEDISQNGERDICGLEEDRPSPSPSPLKVSEDEDEETRYEKNNKGGVTRPYKLKQLFQDSGVTAQTISEMDLDIINLGALGKLLRLNNSLNAPSRHRDAISISFELIQLVAELIRAFLVNIIRLASVMKEQEIRMKGDLKVWKYDRYEISVENVLECLKTMGLDEFSKEQYFAEIIEAGEGQGSSDEVEMLVDEELSSMSDEQSIESEDESSSSSSARTDFSSRSSSVSGSEDDILTTDVDEDALSQELAEEKIQDVLDVVRSNEYEKHLRQVYR